MYMESKLEASILVEYTARTRDKIYFSKLRFKERRQCVFDWFLRGRPALRQSSNAQ